MDHSTVANSQSVFGAGGVETSPSGSIGSAIMAMMGYKRSH